MLNENVFRDVERIVIEPPQRVDPLPGDAHVVIDDRETIREIVSSLRLKVSEPAMIAQCRVPPGFTIRFVGPDRTVVADVTISGHRHFVMDDPERNASVHFDLPREFEELIYPHLMRAVERQHR